MHNKGITRERDFHCVAVEKEATQCVCDCETRRLVEKICDKFNREGNDGMSDHEDARVSRNHFDLFEQADRAERAVTTAAWRKQRD